MKHCASIVAIVGCLFSLSFPAHAANSMAGATGSSAGQDVRVFRLPDSSFSPATVQQASVWDNAAASDPGYWPGYTHSAKYDTFGRTTGYLMVADWNLGSLHAARFLYMGSVFSSADGARKAWDDGRHYLPTVEQKWSEQACPADLNATCARIFAPTTSSDQYFNIEDFILVGNCLIESRTFWHSSLSSQQADQVHTGLANVEHASIDAARPACGEGSTPTPSPTTAPPPTPRPAPTPKPTPKPSHKKVAIHLDWLAATDGSGHTRSSFGVRQDVKIVAAFTVSHLRAGKFVAVTVSRVFEVPVIGGYSRKFSNQETTAVTSNGQHQSVDDTGGFTGRGQFRVVVQLTSGTIHLQSHVDFTVR